MVAKINTLRQALVLCVSLSPLMLLATTGEGQTTSITSSGLGTTVKPGSIDPAGRQNYDITGGSRPNDGPNLFHSFGDFTVGTKSVARFLNDSGLSTSNILSRVTGGNPSAIFGEINTRSFGSANLFLINPAGIVFGPNATLNVGGSTHFSTADYLRLSDGAQFFASLNKQSTLTSAPVTAFGFLASNPASIAVKGANLSVPSGQTISLIGGVRQFPDPDNPTINVPSGVTITGGSLSASSGRINVASVASPGEVIINLPGESPTLNADSFARLGNITMQSATIDVSGNPGGTIFMRGGRLELSNQSHIYGNTTGSMDGPATAIDLQIVALELLSPVLRPNDPSNPLNRFSSIEANAGGSGNGGNIRIHASDHVTLFRSKIGSASLGGEGNTFQCGGGTCGRAGQVNIIAPTLTVEGVTVADLSFDAGIVSSTNGSGAAGTITLNVGTLLVKNSNVPASPLGFAGLYDGIKVDTGGSGAGGSINITADTMRLEHGLITASAIHTKNGLPGNIDIRVGQLDMTEGSLIRAGNAGTNSTAGTITIHGRGSDAAAADSVALSKSTIFTGTTGSGNGGDIGIVAKTINLTDGATISTNSTSTASDAGLAGNIVLASTDNISITGSAVSTSATKASGGDISLTAPNLVRLVGANLTSSVNGPANSNGGNITIDTAHPQFVIMQGNSQILAKANEGQGGAITIIGGVVLQEPGSVLDATAGPAGISGTISIQAPIQQLAGAIAPLPQAFAVATNLYSQRCAAQKGGQVSSFVQGSRDGLPPQPGDLMPSPLGFDFDEIATVFDPDHVGDGSRSSYVGDVYHGSSVVSLRNVRSPLVPSSSFSTPTVSLAFRGCQ
jgi:filamentous hemagglutinin family protein